MVSSTAMAQDNAVTTEVVLLDGSVLDVEAHIPHALDLASWLGNLALDGPGSGGPGDIPPEVALDLQLLELAEPFSVVDISNGFLYLSDPMYGTLILDAKQLAPFHLQEEAMSAVVTDLLVQAGAPIVGPVDVRISNGI
jgi:hypothetical protein